ncbi:MAG TPA: DNA gyrase subunit A [Patescibacteria group bacterium]|nr:DNA gyrase subunit A [Patescibacteria group bacterium]
MSNKESKKIIKKQNIANEKPVSLKEEVESSYIDYAMSVIVSRALPDVRDGLKPVHRRILYAMHKMGLTHDKGYRKSAAIVGETLGKFHPHGDASVYDSLVRMAQDFSLRYPMIKGQGNFGSIDGDSAAAYRYTEAKLTKIAGEMLKDIEEETVDFSSNYDGTIEEPKVLPGLLPSLLVNGSTGIAVGMATKILSHNLGEICDLILLLINKPEADINDLFEVFQGPDFPTGGIIFNIDKMKETYASGKGPIVVRAKTEIVEKEKDKHRIVVNELPYMTNKAKLLTKIAKLIKDKDKRFEDIKDVRDESDKQGVRVVFDLKKQAFPQKVLNNLFKATNLQKTFHVNIVALKDGIQPKVFTLKELVEEYIKHRKNVIRRKTEYNLLKTKQRIHILKGLVIAIDYIDDIIKLIKNSEDKASAEKKLIKAYNLSETQAKAILNIRLHRLANLEQKKIRDELAEKQKISKDLQDILDKPERILDIIKEQTNYLKEEYSIKRRTQVVQSGIQRFNQEDLIPDNPTIVIHTKTGYIKRVSPQNFRSQARGGKGIKAIHLKDEDQISHILSTTTHTRLLFFTSQGRVFQLKTYELPQSTRIARGKALVNFLEIEPDEKISAILPVTDLEKYNYLVMATKFGKIKKVPVKDFKKVRRAGLIAISLKKKDKLGWVKPTSGKDEVILVSNKGKAIRFKETELRSMGRSAQGVKGMKLKSGVIISMDIIPSDKGENFKLLVVSENGYGKMTQINKYRVQSRAGVGIKASDVTKKTGDLVGARIIEDNKGDLLLVSRKGQIIRVSLKSVSTIGRSTQGVKLMRFKEKNDQLTSFNVMSE